MIEAGPAKLKPVNNLSEFYTAQRQQEVFQTLISDLYKADVTEANAEQFLDGLNLGLANNEISQPQYEALRVDINASKNRSIVQEQEATYFDQLSFLVNSSSVSAQSIDVPNLETSLQKDLSLKQERLAAIQLEEDNIITASSIFEKVFSFKTKDNIFSFFETEQVKSSPFIKPNELRNAYREFKTLADMEIEVAATVKAIENYLQNMSYGAELTKLANSSSLAAKVNKFIKDANYVTVYGDKMDILKGIREGRAIEQFVRLFSATVSREEVRKDLNFYKTYYQKNQLIEKFKKNDLIGFDKDLGVYRSTLPKDDIETDPFLRSLESNRRSLARKNAFSQLSGKDVSKVANIIEVFKGSTEKEDVELVKEITTRFEKRVEANELKALYKEFVKDRNNVTTDKYKLVKVTDETTNARLFKSEIEQPLLRRTRAVTYSKFKNGTSVVIPFITGITDEKVREEITDEYLMYLSLRKSIQPSEFTTATEFFKRDTDAAPFEIEYQGENRKLNNEAMRALIKRYRRTLKPLIDSFRTDPSIADKMEEIAPRKVAYEKNKKRFLRQRVKELEEQRTLTPTEKNYIRSVERLTLMNPDMIAALSADFVSANAYLKNHFEKISEETKKELSDGKYYPLIVMGAGPHGIIAMGEIMRKYPELASQALVIDQGKQPGGPFAIPNGQAWDLNSANGNDRKKLPRESMILEDETVRAYGSPLRWYPGERLDKNIDQRGGSINKLVDWLPDPDQLSLRKYPSNEELQIVLSLHGALCIDKASFETSVKQVVPAEDGKKGSKILTVVFKSGEITKEIELRTDNLIVATGLGEPSFGFELNRTRAKKVLRQSKISDGFPKVTTTLEAFKALADRSRTAPLEDLGSTIAIYGIGNSTDVLAEYLGRQFPTDVSDVKKIEKIYIISDGVATKRPRYAKIEDLRDRIGKKNLISVVSARVADFSYDEDEKNVLPAERKLVLYDKADNLIRDTEGNVVKVDNIIAATGFKSQLDEIFEEYLVLKKTMQDGRKNVVLPTNEEVTVGQTFEKDESILFVGTASDPQFDESKKSQLPEEAREVLERVGKESIVAIGFRGPDTQAAVNIFLSRNTFDLESDNKTKIETIDVGKNVKKREKYVPLDKEAVGRIISALPKRRTSKNELVIKTPEVVPSPIEMKAEVPVQISKSQTSEVGLQDRPLMEANDVARVLAGSDPKRVLSSVLSYSFSNTKLVSEGVNVNDELRCTISLNRETDTITISGLSGYSKEFGVKLFGVVSDSFFQQYALTYLRRSRGLSPQLSLNIAIKNGRVDSENTFVQ